MIWVKFPVHLCLLIVHLYYWKLLDNRSWPQRWGHYRFICRVRHQSEPYFVVKKIYIMFHNLKCNLSINFGWFKQVIIAFHFKALIACSLSSLGGSMSCRVELPPFRSYSYFPIEYRLHAKDSRILHHHITSIHWAQLTCVWFVHVAVGREVLLLVMLMWWSDRIIQ
jgi:hypothetical protein